ncbi:MAG: prolipoprotein diacylglyceryl transferase [Acidimicrobiales bacterium]
MLAAIPYTTFPEISLGPLTLRTFGLMVALGVIAGSTIAARWGERWGISSEKTMNLATRMVVAGIVGSRITWNLTHLSEIESPIDLIAVWNGGLQFSGGFILAVVVGLPTLRSFDLLTRWRLLDGMGLAMTVGAAFGRIGCYAVGEHLGNPTSFFLATRYDGGDTREGPLLIGQTIHNTSLYEFISLVVLSIVLSWLLYKRKSSPGTALGVFLIWYGSARLGTDFLRAYDELTFGLTGAQWMCLVLVPIGLWVLVRKRPALAQLVHSTEAGPEPEASPEPSTEGSSKDGPDETEEANGDEASADTSPKTTKTD